jgi:hypothetical protein
VPPGLRRAIRFFGMPSTNFRGSAVLPTGIRTTMSSFAICPTWADSPARSRLIMLRCCLWAWNAYRLSEVPHLSAGGAKDVGAERTPRATSPALALLRRINPVVTGVLADLRDKLAAFYSEIGDVRRRFGGRQHRLSDRARAR